MTGEDYKSIAAQLEELKNGYKSIAAQLEEQRNLVAAGCKDVLNIAECALYTGFAQSTIYKLTSENRIPFYKPNGGRIYFKKTELNAWLLRERQMTVTEINRKANAICAMRNTASRTSKQKVL